MQSLADHLRRHLRTDQGVDLWALRVPKAASGFVGFGDVVVHVFKEDERDFYDLEGLWQDAPRIERRSLPEAVGRT